MAFWFICISNVNQSYIWAISVNCYPNLDLPSAQLIAVLHLFAFAVDLISYLTRFEWDMAKYPIKQPLKNISEALAKVNCAPDF